MPPIVAPPVPPARTRDPLTGALLVATFVLAGLTVIAFGGYELLLSSGVSNVQNAGLTSQ
jgi:hypothetical protein